MKGALCALMNLKIKKAQPRSDLLNPISIQVFIKIVGDKLKKIKSKFRFSILIGEFYSIETAENLKKKISHELRGFKAERLNIKVVEKNKIRLISGSYNSINLLKNDYMLLKNFGFEELDGSSVLVKRTHNR